MKLYKSDKVRFIFGLIFIILIYSAYYLYFVDNLDWEISRKLRHFGTFLTTIIIYFIGTFHLGKLSDSWMSTLWHMVHISGLCILSLLGFYDWFILSQSPLKTNIAIEMTISNMMYQLSYCPTFWPIRRVQLCIA